MIAAVPRRRRAAITGRFNPWHGDGFRRLHRFSEVDPLEVAALQGEDETGLRLADGPVVRTLSALVGPRTINYLPLPGNGGDAVINVGFFDLARSLHLGYRLIGPDAQLNRDDTLVVAGGGGLSAGVTFVPRLLQRFSQEVGALIVLPHTVDGHEQMLQGFGANVTLILREKVSYGHVKAVTNGPQVLLDHDMAFHADLESLLKHRRWPVWTASPKKLVRLAKLTSLRRRSRSVRQLNAFRTDREASGHFKATEATDISKLATFGVRSEDAAYFSASQLALTINAFDEISTDRLHVGIISGRLGKRTVLYDNNYFKCRAVFDHSLRNFGNVTMRGAADAEDSAAAAESKRTVSSD